LAWGRANLSVWIPRINVAKAGVFKPYIAFFDSKMGVTENIPHRRLIA